MKNISQKDLFAKNIDKFLKSFRKAVSLTIHKGMRLNFKIDTRSENAKISPILRLATPEEARVVVEICKDTYEGTYPYKEFEDEKSVRFMIESPFYDIILFQDDSNDYIGCFMCNVFYDERKAYMGSFMIKKRYQGKVDIVKAIIGSYIWMWNTYKDKIDVWYCENRTAHATSQYITSVCGIKTVAILPNKDIFFNKVETDVLGIIYNEKALRKLRRKDFPKIIAEVNNCFLYSNKKFDLGPVEFVNHNNIELNEDKIKKLEEIFIVRSDLNEIGYEKLTFSFKGTNSFFSFTYTPWLHNFEKAEYKVKNLEELFFFIEKLKHLTKEFDIRYVEVYVSAYKPDHQKLFYECGLMPRGYVPCWKYNKKLNFFEDHIVFNVFKGDIKNMILLPDGLELLEVLNLPIV